MVCRPASCPSGEQVVTASELAAAVKKIKEPQRLLGKKTMENELLKEAVEYGRAKNVIECDLGKLERIINARQGFKSMKTAYALHH